MIKKKQFVRFTLTDRNGNTREAVENFQGRAGQKSIIQKFIDVLKCQDIIGWKRTQNQRPQDNKFPSATKYKLLQPSLVV